jgi:hypothetical protein
MMLRGLLRQMFRKLRFQMIDDNMQYDIWFYHGSESLLLDFKLVVSGVQGNDGIEPFRAGCS